MPSLRRCECVAHHRPQVRAVLLGSDEIGSIPDMCTVSPVAGGAHEVMVQGKQTSAVLELLGRLGVPEKWIDVSNIVGKKK